MTAHPCAGHDCDHCYICDELRVCCGSISAEQLVQLEAERHRLLVLAEVAEAPSTAELVCEASEQWRHEIATVGVPVLPAAPTQTIPNPRKEAPCRQPS